MLQTKADGTEEDKAKTDIATANAEVRCILDTILARLARQLEQLDQLKIQLDYT